MRQPACGPDPVNQDFATGLLLFNAAAGTMVTNNNTFTANDIGIYNLAQGTTIMRNTLSSGCRQSAETRTDDGQDPAAVERPGRSNRRTPSARLGFLLR